MLRHLTCRKNKKLNQIARRFFQTPKDIDKVKLRPHLWEARLADDGFARKSRCELAGVSTPIALPTASSNEAEAAVSYPVDLMSWRLVRN